jgi:hypothetical protein
MRVLPFAMMGSLIQVVVFVGGVAVFCASRKYKFISKSPTEAELIALSNNLGFIELFHEFISFLMNAIAEIPLIYQDNTSVISMVTSGGGNHADESYENSNVFGAGIIKGTESNHSLHSYIRDDCQWLD